MSDHPESARHFLNNPAFQGIHRRVALHEELLRRVRAALPAPLAARCLHCVALEGGKLVLYTDSQAFATQFRFLAPSLQKHLNAEGGGFAVNAIAVRNFRPEPPGAAEKARPPMAVPSEDAIEAVRAGGEIAGDDELGQALARLAVSMDRYARERR